MRGAGVSMGVVYVAGVAEGAGASTVATGLAAALRAAGHEAAQPASDALTGGLDVVDGLPLGPESAAEAERLDARVIGVLPYERGLDGAAAGPWSAWRGWW